ncbi:hypothetical protein ACFFRR_009639 [Megaselia abdita]
MSIIHSPIVTRSQSKANSDSHFAMEDTRTENSIAPSASNAAANTPVPSEDNTTESISVPSGSNRTRNTPAPLGEVEQRTSSETNPVSSEIDELRQHLARLTNHINTLTAENTNLHQVINCLQSTNAASTSVSQFTESASELRREILPIVQSQVSTLRTSSIPTANLSIASPTNPIANLNVQQVITQSVASLHGQINVPVEPTQIPATSSAQMNYLPTTIASAPLMSNQQ